MARSFPPPPRENRRGSVERVASFVTLLNPFAPKRRARRRWNSPNVPAEVLENRILLSISVEANDDYATIHHDQEVEDGLSVLYNDVIIDPTEVGNGPFTASLVSDPSSGTVEFEDGAAWNYIPAPGFVGVDSFTYRATYDGVSDTATVYITVTNETPVWNDWLIKPLGERWAEADGSVFQTGEIIGQIGASDYVEDTLTYSGAGSGLIINADGTVEVTDGVILTAALDAGGVSCAVFCTDGVETIASTLVLDKHSPLDVIDQTEIYVEDSAGGVYNPGTAGELLTILEGIRTQGNTVTVLILKGHGSEDGIQVGDDGEYLTVEGTIVDIGGTNVGQLLNDVTDGNTSISLRGCNIRPLAQRLDDQLGDDPDVYGSSWYALGIPWTRWAIYP